MIPCCERKGIEYCFDCDEFPCKKYDGADIYDSFITHKNQFVDMEKAKRIGMEAYSAALHEKIGIFEELLGNYNGGRRKNLYCMAVNLLELQDIRAVMEQIGSETVAETSVKAKAAAAVRLFEEMAELRGISMKLRKKQS